MKAIPQKIRKIIDQDPYYKACCLYGQHSHVCEGRITMEHAIIFAGNQVQELWAILPLCAGGHGVDSHQDKATTTKELRVWVALNRATKSELQAISKAINYIRERDRLNAKYGPYMPKVPEPKDLIKAAPPTERLIWYPLKGDNLEKVEKLQQFFGHLGHVMTVKDVVTECISLEYRSIGKMVEREDPEIYKEIGFDK